jgi:hypothetical protein
MTSRSVAFHVAVLVFAGLSRIAPATAQPIPIAIMGSPDQTSWMGDVRDKLVSTNQFSTIDTYDIANGTPTLAQMQAYKAILVFSDSPGYKNSTAFGNNLAAYVDASGGVVVAVFADASIHFSGAFDTEDYWAIEPFGQGGGKALTLGTMHDPGSPLLTGVLSFQGGKSSYYGTGALNAAAVDVADWSNGVPLIATRVINGTNRVDLNFYPPSSGVRSDFWVRETDGGKLMANALNYVAGVAPAPQPSWISAAPSGTPPAARADASAIYNSTANQMIVFGGNTGPCSGTAPSLNDTWVLAGANGLAGTPAWAQVAAGGTLPPGRAGHSAVYNSATDRMIVFAGDSMACSSQKLNDVWVLSNASGAGGTPTWQSLTASGGPPPARSGHVAAYDQASNQMIVYGGAGASVNLTDLWVLSGADGTSGTPQWTNPVPTGTGPTATTDLAGTYDAGANVMTVFGGFTCCSGPASNRAYFLSNANGSEGTPQWSSVLANGTPPTARVGPVGVYNSTSKLAEYFGASGTNSLWSLTNANGTAPSEWTKLVPTGTAPAGRGGLGDNPAMVMDPVSNRLIIFGGAGPAGFFNDVWILAQ